MSIEIFFNGIYYLYNDSSVYFTNVVDVDYNGKTLTVEEENGAFHVFQASELMGFNVKKG